MRVVPPSCARLCVRVEALFGARGVDVVQLLLLLGLDVLVLLHPAGVLQVTPVSSQRHQEVHLARQTRGASGGLTEAHAQ